jgi:hypothetical protein
VLSALLKKEFVRQHFFLEGETMKEEVLKVTSPEEYAVKAARATAEESVGFLHKLKKTGAVVRLRRADMEALAVMGQLPMSLVRAAARAVDTEEDAEAPSKKKPTSEEIEEGVKTAIFIRQMVVDNCLEPRIQHQEGVGVFFVYSLDMGDMQTEMRVRVDKDDFYEMFAVISGEEGADGLENFRNRKERRSSASKSNRKTLRTGPVPVENEGQPTPA